MGVYGRAVSPEKARELAWVGDSILGLYARLWILENTPDASPSRPELFSHFTSNRFLTGLGEPTLVEAQIGEVFLRDGLAPSFAFITERLLPLFVAQINKKSRNHRGPIYPLRAPALPASPA